METIDISSSLDRFETHILTNPRTVFSARFGDGKTFFMQRYIELHRGEKVIIDIHPLNYSVSNNEDIFEYIKRDILFKLSKEKEFEIIDWNSVRDDVFSFESRLELADIITESLPYSKLLMFPFHLFKRIDDKFAIDKFFDKFKNQRGSIFERDDYTVAIQKTIQKIQAEGKKCILLIEDLDRLDPGHLFRILNVLGAHIDEDLDTNKFGFDNIVITLDYRATEHLFHHFYGKYANYEGYMSKFMSHVPFYYSIVSEARTYLREYLIKECLLNDAFLSGPLFEQKNPKLQYMSLDDVIGTLSVRDVTKILTSIDAQILREVKEKNIQTVSPITRLLVILVRMNIPFSHSRLVNLASFSIESLEVLSNCLLLDSRIHQGRIKVGNDHFIFKREANTDGYSQIVRFVAAGGRMNETRISDIVDHCLKTIYSWVFDCESMVKS